jgi:hypothetical protein
MIKQIKIALIEAEQNRQKMAMFHFLVLQNAESLKNVDPVDFCREVGVRDTYATEFRKMIKLHQVMKAAGVSLV